MTDLLIKLCIRNKEDVNNEEVREKYGLLSSITGIIVNILLSAFKIVIGILANSMSIISDGLNNVTDAGSSVITMIGFKISGKEVDNDHPWGHGRMEYITAFIVDILIILVGVELFKSSIEKIIHPELPAVSNITIILLIVAVLVKLWLFVFYRKIAKLINSSAIKANSYDSISDSVSTLVVLGATIVARFSGVSIDGFASLFVSAFILFTGFKALKEIVDILLGGKPDEEFINAIIEFTKGYPMISGIHDIMVHDYGPGRKIVSFHVEVPDNCDICKAHDVIDGLEQDLYKEFKCITTIHMDPIVVNDEKVNNMRKTVEKLVSDIDEQYSIHDFRMTDGGSRVNLIFDLVVPRDGNIDKAALENEIKRRIHEIDSRYYAVVKVEFSFV